MQAEEASEKLRHVVTPYVERSKQAFEPIRNRLALQETAGLQTSLLPIQELARRMRENLGQRS